MNILKIVIATTCSTLCLASPLVAQAGDGDYMGEIFMTAASFCPRGTASLEGQILSISRNAALFSLLGTTYGGDGRVSFGLPDMRGRSPVQRGEGPGLSLIELGQHGGSESIQLDSARSVGPKSGDEQSSIVARAHKPVNIRSPFLGINYCIVMEGLYPSRS